MFATVSHWHLFVFKAVFPLGEGSRDNSPRWNRNTSYGFQQSLRILLVSHHDGTKSGRTCCNHTTLTTSPWVQPAGFASPIFPGAYWSHGRTIVAEISLFGDVTRHLELCEFHSCALCREVSRCELFAKTPPQPLALKITLFQSLPTVHHHW